MRKFLVCLIVLLVVSCSTSDDSTQDVYYDILPIESVVLPDTFTLNEVYEISLTWLRPSNCHAFNDIYYSRELNERTVAIIAIIFTENNNCEEISDEIETSFDFKPTETGTYIFKFWQGEDDNGIDQYLIIEVPVID